MGEPRVDEALEAARCARIFSVVAHQLDSAIAALEGEEPPTIEVPG